MFHVYRTSAGSELIAVDTTDCNSIQEVEAVLAANGWSGQNWYGASASTADEAIEKAKQSGFKYRSAEEMKNLKSRLGEFQ